MASVEEIRNAVSSGDFNGAEGMLTAAIVGTDISKLEYYAQYLRCSVAKQDLASATSFADLLIAIPLEEMEIEKPPFTDAVLNFVNFAGERIWHLNPDLDKYKKFIEDFAKYDRACGDNVLILLMCNTAIWLNMSDYAQANPTHAYFDQLYNCLAYRDQCPGHGQLFDMMEDYLLKLGAID